MNRNQRNWDEVPGLFGDYNRLSDVQKDVFWGLYELFRRYVLRNFGREGEFWVWTWPVVCAKSVSEKMTAVWLLISSIKSKSYR
jgi:hypothetical protein